MNTRAILTFGAAFVLAGGSVMLTKSWLASQVQPPVIVEQAPVEMTPVVVAATPLEFGAPVERGQLKVIQWPTDAAPTGVFQSVEELVDGEEPRVVLRSIEQNEPLLPSKVSGFGGRASLSAVIDQDKRATTIRVNDVNGVAGFVLPGDRVDIMLTRSNKDGDLVTDVLLQTVRVLAIDQDNDPETEEPVVAKAVTLEVTPKQAQKLALASQLGSLSLALRGEANTGRVSTQSVSVTDLEGGKKRGETGNRFKVKIVRGMEAQNYAVQPGQSTGALVGVPVVPANPGEEAALDAPTPVAASAAAPSGG